jgi:hypothetical protein
MTGFQKETHLRTILCENIFETSISNNESFGHWNNFPWPAYFPDTY